jgi:competence protein ComEA
MKLALLAFLIVAAVRVATASPQVAAAQPPSDADKEREVFEMTCGVCHESNLIGESLRSPAEWDELISLMQGYGAGGTPEQFAQARAFMLRSFGRVNVNSAAAIDLAPVLDVTPDQAGAVIAYRDQNGRFATVDDLKRVPGLDIAKIEARKERLMF